MKIINENRRAAVVRLTQFLQMKIRRMENRLNKGVNNVWAKIGEQNYFLVLFLVKKKPQKIPTGQF